ncbi:hypothetical protein [Roseateles sp.]|uniref:hypothetical protein n=1 Tax=Roseateles sp. TaxID=1971397 RepID=UPI0025D2BC1E|nr:hypothetical protein [Roseateles sp.]
MRSIVLPTLLCAALACQAAGSDTAVAEPAAGPASTVISPPKGRCPPPRIDKLRKMPTGDFDFVIRFLVRADGSIENVRVEGGLASRDARYVARDLFDGLRCLPAEADQEYVAKFSTRMGSF